MKKFSVKMFGEFELELPDDFEIGNVSEWLYDLGFHHTLCKVLEKRCELLTMKDCAEKKHLLESNALEILISRVADKAMRSEIKEITLLDIGKPTHEDLMKLDPDTMLKLHQVNTLIDNTLEKFSTFEEDIDVNQQDFLQPLYDLRYKYQSILSKKYWDQFPEIKREVLEHGLFGHLFTADIHKSSDYK